MRQVPLLLLFFLPCIAQGEQSSALFAMTLEDLLQVQVTSTSFSGEPIAETNYSVTRTGAREWQDLGVRNLGDVMNHMPSTLAVSGSGESRLVAVRGYLSSATDGGVAMRLDGVPMNRLLDGSGQVAMDGYDLSMLQSAELIRGPGSSLHGNDAFHGVLSLETLHNARNNTKVEASVGEFDYVQASLATTVHSGQHNVTLGAAYRSIGDMAQPYEYFHYLTGEPLQSQRKQAKENANLLLKYGLQQGDMQLDASYYMHDFNADELPGAGDQFFTSLLQDKDHISYQDTTHVFRIGASQQQSDARSLQASAFYWVVDNEFYGDFRGYLPGGSRLGSELLRNRQEVHWGLNLQQQFHFSTQSHLTLAYEYLAQTLEKDYSVVRNLENEAVVDGTTELQGFSRKVHSLVLDGRQPLNQHGLMLSYGLRLDAYDDLDQQYSPRLGLTQVFSEKQKLHATVGTAFRAPGILELFGDQGAGTLPNDSLNPETLVSYDLKYLFETKNVLQVLTLFTNVWQEAIQRELVSEDKLQYQNSGKNSAYGAEYELKGRWQKWQSDLALSYIRSKNDESGEPYDAFPHWIADIKLVYLFSDNWKLCSSNRYTLRDAIAADAPESPGNIDYFRSDLTLSWVNQALTLSVALRNIFDRENSMPSPLYMHEGLWDESRNISAAIKYQF